jgi:hypothetical protein
MSVESELSERAARRLVGWFGILVASCGGGTSAGELGAGGQAGADAETAAGSDGGSLAPPPFAVLTNRYDNDRTGANTRETILDTSNVAAPGRFGLLFSRMYEGNAYAQPLYVGGLAIAGGKHNVVFVATSTNDVYAFDADDPSAVTPYWTRRIAPLGHITIGGADDRENPIGTTWCKDMYPFSGVTGTPVIDLETSRMYLVSQEGNAPGPYLLKLHALDLATGTEVAGGPTIIDATVDGTGEGNVGGKLRLDGWRQFNRAGLTLHDGVLYVALTSHCDEFPFHGWLLAYDPATLAQKSVFNTSPNHQGAAIWQSGNGIAANERGLFYCTGNGDYTADGSSLGTSVVRMNLDDTLGDFFTPSNADVLNDRDKDLTAGVLLIPNSKYLVSGGKEGVVYLIDQTNMTKFNAAGDQIAQRVTVGTSHIHDFVFYADHIYVWPDDAPLKVYPYAEGRIDDGPSAVKTFAGYTPSHPGGIMTISANGNSAGSAILWATLLSLGDAWHAVGIGALVALDASDVTKVLFDSTKDANDALGNLAKFSPPTVANGKVYVTTFADVNATSPSYLRVYGLKN